MSIPMTGRFIVANAITATATTELHTITNNNGQYYAQGILFEVVGSATPNWTLAFQGKTHPSGTYANWDYIQVANGMLTGVVTATLTVNDTTRRFYLLLNPPQFVQIVATRTGGTLTVYGAYTSVTPVFPQALGANGQVVSALQTTGGDGANNAFEGRLLLGPGDTNGIRLAIDNYAFNGTGWDRMVSGYASGPASRVGILNVLPMLDTGSGGSADTNAASAQADAIGGGSTPPAALWLWNGATWDRQRTAAKFVIVAAVAITAATGATIWTPASGKKFRLMGYSFSASAAASLIFGDNVVGTVIFRGPLLAAAGIDSQYNLGNGFLSAAANNVLKLDVSANATVTGTVWGTEE